MPEMENFYESDQHCFALADAVALTKGWSSLESGRPSA